MDNTLNTFVFEILQTENNEINRKFHPRSKLLNVDIFEKMLKYGVKTEKLYPLESFMELPEILSIAKTKKLTKFLLLLQYTNADENINTLWIDLSNKIKETKNELFKSTKQIVVHRINYDETINNLIEENEKITIKYDPAIPSDSNDDNKTDSTHKNNMSLDQDINIDNLSTSLILTSDKLTIDITASKLKMNRDEFQLDKIEIILYKHPTFKPQNLLLNPQSTPNITKMRGVIAFNVKDIWAYLICTGIKSNENKSNPLSKQHVDYINGGGFIGVVASKNQYSASKKKILYTQQRILFPLLVEGIINENEFFHPIDCYKEIETKIDQRLKIFRGNVCGLISIDQVYEMKKQSQLQLAFKKDLLYTHYPAKADYAWHMNQIFVLNQFIKYEGRENLHEMKDMEAISLIIKAIESKEYKRIKPNFAVYHSITYTLITGAIRAELTHLHEAIPLKEINYEKYRPILQRSNNKISQLNQYIETMNVKSLSIIQFNNDNNDNDNKHSKIKPYDEKMDEYDYNNDDDDDDDNNNYNKNDKHNKNDKFDIKIGDILKQLGLQQYIEQFGLNGVETVSDLMRLDDAKPFTLQFLIENESDRNRLINRLYPSRHHRNLSTMSLGSESNINNK